MSDTTPMMTRAEFEARVIKKAWQDPAYKERLLKDPKAALEEELRAVIPGITLPAELNVTAHEESPQSVCITLPVNPAEYADRLAELAGDKNLLSAAATDVIAPMPVYTVVVNVITPPAINVVAPALVNVGPITPFVITAVQVVA